MNKNKEQYFHAQAAKLDLRRKWQSMAIWPIVYRFGDRLKMEFEYQYGRYKVDLYIPAIQLVVEIDEPHHEYQQEADTDREREIAAGLGCEFVRIKVADPAGVYEQIERLCESIQCRVERSNPPDWDVAPKIPRPTHLSREGGYSEAHIQQLKDNGIPKLVDDMKLDLAALQIDLSDDLGPVVPGNGELGFSVLMPGMKFCVSIRANQQAKLLVTDYSTSALETLGISLDGPKGGRIRYWVINELTGRFGIECLIGTLATYKQLLDSRERAQ